MFIYNILRAGVIALGIVVVVVAGLFLYKATKGKKADKKNRLFNISATAVAAVSLAVILLANYFTTLYANSINAVMTVFEGAEAETTAEDWKQLALEISEEGMVLMKNDNTALPLAKGTKVNLLGYYAYNPLYSGTGSCSGNVSVEDSWDIVSSLTSAGIEINPALQDAGIYPAAEKSAPDQSIGFQAPSYSIDEVPITSYTGDVSFESLAAYSDTAIVVIGRNGGEGADLTSYTEGDYLKLNQNETDLLSKARETFAKVIVVLDCANPMEMGWMNEYGVDAVVWAGLPGPYGFEALGKILTGEVNPSGSLPDTWVYDNDSAPASENFGEQAASNAEGRFYVDYVEGIYVGYKWYETAYAEKAVITNTKTGEVFDYNDYDSVVAFPFGYGLSYTGFSQEITGGSLAEGTSLNATDTYTVEVTVTNTGSTAGKTSVQLYVTAPYTDYDKEHKVEKAAVSLVDFGKTGVLEPGASEVVTIEVPMEAIASYDASCTNADGTSGSYMLDAGTYVFSVRDDAHTALDQVTATVASQYFFSGANKRSSDAVVATNQFAQAERGEYLSRQNSFANYASAMGSVKDTIEDDSYTTTPNLYDPALDEVVTETYVEGEDYSVPGDMTLADMTGAAYDDPRWEELISQMSLEDLMTLTGETTYSSPAIESIGKSATTDSDGPMGISSMYSNELNTVVFPCVPIQAATFNTDLAHRMGNCVADEAKTNSISIWYSPAMDLHRSPYGGRVFEYYSEDATLCAKTAAAEVGGAREKGQLMYIKHFFMNEMETNRAFLHTYSNEQAIRELYLKPFEYAVKDGGATGVMTSMNYIGDVYAGAHVGLLTNVLRGEWGFQGSVLTDMDEGNEFRNYLSTLRAGVDIWLGFNPDNRAEPTNADIYYLQRAAHNQLYFLANGNTYSAKICNWTAWRTVVYAELGVLAAACVVAMVLRNKKKVQ